MAKKLVAPKPPAVPADIRRLPAADQRRLDLLMAKNNRGNLSVTERDELTSLVRTVESLALANAKRLAESH